MSDIQQSLQEVTELISLPEVYLKVQGLMHDSGSDICDFAEVVNADPKLSAEGKHLYLNASCIEQKPLFKKLPSNIDEIVIRAIEANTDPVLGLLWPGGDQGLSAQQAEISNA